MLHHDHLKAETPMAIFQNNDGSRPPPIWTPGNLAPIFEEKVAVVETKSARQRLSNMKAQSIISKKQFKKEKPFAEMSEAEKKQRVRQLWTKVRMFVRLGRSLFEIREDIE